MQSEKCLFEFIKLNSEHLEKEILATESEKKFSFLLWYYTGVNINQFIAKCFHEISKRLSVRNSNLYLKYNRNTLQLVNILNQRNKLCARKILNFVFSCQNVC